MGDGRAAPDRADHEEGPCCRLSNAWSTIPGSGVSSESASPARSARWSSSNRNARPGRWRTSRTTRPWSSTYPTLGIMFPESRFPRDMAAAIFQTIVAEIRKRSGKDVHFTGFVYDDMGNVKQTK